MSRKDLVRRQGGFTLMELMVTLGLIAIMMTLGGLSVRQYWLAQSLEGAVDQIVTEMRGALEDARSESAPLVFGMGFVAGTSNYNVYRFDPVGPGTVDDACTRNPRAFNTGVFNGAVTFQTVTITNDTVAPEYVACDSLVAGSDKIVFFYARGTSTGGSLVLLQPSRGTIRTVTISAATGRVTST